MKGIQFVIGILLAVLIQSQISYAADREMKEWTFLVFMNGHDSALDPFTGSNLQLMQKVGSTEDVNIVVQVASLEREQTERVLINKGSHEVIQKLPRVDMGDYRELNKFIEWTVENYPAKKYFINVWNHGSGWHDLQLKNQEVRNLRTPKDFESHDVSFDSLSGNFITTEQMGKVMANFKELIGHKVDLYGNDACLMSMIEVVAEFTDSVSYFASSQENEPLAGWPYDKMLARLATNPSMDGKQLGVILTEEYLKYYPDDSANPVGTTFSTIDVSQVKTLMESLGNLTNELMGLGSSNKAALVQVAVAAHRFDGSTDYKDLYDFILKLENHSFLNVNKSVLSDVKDAFKNVVVKSVTTESESNAHGLSVWLPTYEIYYAKHADRYRNLEFSKTTKWSNLVDFLFGQQ